MCTGIQLTAKTPGGAVALTGRTLEYEMPLGSAIQAFPANYQYASLVQSPRSLAWAGTRGVVGINAFGLDRLIEGINDVGLAAGAFLFPSYAAYRAPEPFDLTSMDVVSWILSICGSIDEVKNNLDVLAQVADFKTVTGGSFPALHYWVRDAFGKSLVLEHVKGTNGEVSVLTHYDNPHGAFTNSPPFPFHVANLGNYVNLSATNIETSSLFPAVSTTRRKFASLARSTGGAIRKAQTCGPVTKRL